MAKNPPANVGHMGSIPGPGRFHMPRGKQAHEPQLLGPHALEPVLCNEKPLAAARVALTHYKWRKPSCGKEDPAQSKMEKKIKRCPPAV